MSKCYLFLLFLAAFLLPAASAVSCHSDDLRALRGFVGNLSGGGVLLRAAWSGASCCSREGVGCDGASGHVTTLSLPGRRLAGPILGISLTGLVRLESLNLANNSRLVGTITSWIGELDHLRHLDLSHTSLVGENRRALGGQPNTITGTHNAVRSGTKNVVSGNHNTVISGNYNVVAGSHNNVVTGSNNAVSGNHHVVSGRNHVVSGSHNTVSGSNNVV